jgi:hypothetical protein
MIEFKNESFYIYIKICLFGSISLEFMLAKQARDLASSVVNHGTEMVRNEGQGTRTQNTFFLLSFSLICAWFEVLKMLRIKDI